MKISRKILVMFVFATFFAACTNEFDDLQTQDGTLQNAAELRTAGTTVSLMSELDAYTLNSSNGIVQGGKCGYYWNQTYTATKIALPHFTFSHTGGVVTGYNYWDGFTVSNVADTTEYGIPGPPGDTLHSQPWVKNQWGCMAVPTQNPPCTKPRPNFLVGYWGYYGKEGFDKKIDTSTVFSEDKYSNWVKLGTGTQTHTVTGIKVAMSPWAYYGIKYGDGFARPFHAGDSFDLIVYGVDENNRFVKSSPNADTVQSIIINLAKYPDKGSLIMSDTWTDKSINFAKPVKYLVFQMESSDKGKYGPNTAVYFCLRDIVMQ